MATPNWQNRTLFHGDNLAFMRAMNSESVDLIATDPPFNKGKDFHATPDSLAAGAKFQDRWSWERDVHEDWIEQIREDWEHVIHVIQGSRSSYGDDMGAFLAFMAVRLIAMHRLLKPTGSIYLHCDHTASHYLKELMDAVFGKKNFRNEIIWCYSTSGRAKRFFAKKHDTILLYSKSNDAYWGDYRIPVSPEYLASHYRQRDEQGRVCRIRTDFGKVRVYYPDEGMTCNDWWEMPYVNSMSKDRTGWPTQKPIELYARMIEASTERGGVVLDPFAGCATTLVAAEKLEREWVGIDIWEHAERVVKARMENTTGLFGEVAFTDKPPDRTDDGETAAPFLRVKERVDEPDGPKWNRKQMFDHLLAQGGVKCQGCDRVFDDPRYLELDHNTPRADGGWNHISNRVLLCGPCNRLKSNIYTLSGLRRINKQRGYMAG